MATAKDNLMNSLMGGGDEDLFGNVPVDTPSSTQPPPAEPPVVVPSLLAASGLLGGDNNNGTNNKTSGLFDSIDEEEQQKAQEERRREVQRQQEEAEAARRQQQQEEEQRKQKEEARQAAMQEQMQSIHLGPTTMMPQGGGSYQNAPQPSSFPMNQSAAVYGSPNGMMNQSGGGRMHQSMMQQPSMMQQSGMMPHQSSMMQQSSPQPMMQHSSPQPMMQQSNMMMQQPNMTMQQPNMTMQPNHMQQPMQQPMNNSMMMPQSRVYQSPGMHGVSPSVYANVPQNILYEKIIISEPLLLNSSGSNFLGIGQPPHWSYQITTFLQDQTTSWVVRRRFRHVVALEDRLRENCPGAILPPRPDKHATRAIEEASAHQSAEFAVQRAAELQVYLNQLIRHPIASTSIVLRLFLTLQDDLGTAWPECSSNALTRLANASVGAAVKVSESTANLQTDASEDNAELLALQNAESSRIGAVLQAVPKLEGAVTLLREHAEESLAVGMEFSRVAKEAAEAQPMDIASAGLLRSGRRSKRLGLELSAALQSFSHQYKLCRYERMAFADRRAAIARRHKERHRADQRASQMMHNHQFGMAQSAAMMDDMANDAGHECEEIGQRLKSEVHRVAQMRRAEWSASVKIVASAMKEALSERVAIWESVQENFFQAYPEFKPIVDGDPRQPQH